MKSFSSQQNRAHRFSLRPWTALSITALLGSPPFDEGDIPNPNRLSHLPNAHPLTKMLRFSQQSKAACAARSKRTPVPQFGDCRSTGFPLGILA